MKRFLRWFIAIAGVIVLLLVIAVLCRDVVLKAMAVRRLQQALGLRAEIGTLKTGLRTPSILLRNARIFNPPDFGPSPLIEVPEIFAELDGPLAAEGKLHFKELRLHVAELNVIRDRKGRFNLSQFDEEDEKRAPSKGGTNTHRGKFEFAGIDRMQVTIGKIKFTDLQKPSRSRDIEVGLRDEVVTGLQTEQDLEIWIGNNLIRLLVQEVKKPDKNGKARHVDLFIEPFREEAATNSAPAKTSP